MREHEVLARLAAQLGPTSARMLVGIGDDAAVLTGSAANLVVTNDASVEGVHFTREIASLSDIGFRATMAAASDLAAMGARPIAAVSALMLAPAPTEAEIDALMAGQAEAARELGAPIVGGNMSRGPVLSITTTWLGECAAPVLRSGARAGDRVWLAGEIGHAAAGLRLLLAGVDVTAEPLARTAAAWRRPRARIAAGLALAGRASSLIDISDGMVADAAHVARASKVLVQLDADAILSAGGDALRIAAELLSLDPLGLALGGGEDYALLATSAEDLSDLGWRHVGQVTEGEPRVRVIRDDREIDAPPGFDHFRA